MSKRRVLIKSSLFGVAILLAGGQLFATTIQLSPLVGRRGVGMYRAPSYLRSADQYAKPAEADYTVKLGNMRIRLALGLEAEYTDNVNRSEDNEDDALSLTPMIYTTVYWPINPGFQVHSGISVGFRTYVSGGSDADDDGLILQGTDGAFNAQIGADMRIGTSGILSLSEEFVRTMDSFEVRANNNSRGKRYALNRNLVSLQYRNEFSDLTSGTAKFAHKNEWTDDSDFEERDHFSDFIDVALLRRINRSVQVGPYARAGLYRYTEDLHNDSEHYEGGLSIVYNPHERFALSGSVGFSHVTFDTDNNPAADDEYSGLTTQTAATYSSNRAITHRLTLTYGGEQGHTGAGSNYSRDLAAEYTISIQLREDVLVNADAGYINADESDGGADYELYRLGIGTGYRLTRDTTVDLRYRYEWREARSNGYEYNRNSVVLRLVHQF